jgi:diaminohydroxyphosphoribosylaminopyrimidine deaminase / 5-amino-6-(5-phosphoribosylamino)uracil reductase
MVYLIPKDQIRQMKATLSGTGLLSAISMCLLPFLPDVRIAVMEDYMRQALALARLAQGQVSPNPAVGAVIVRDGEIVGQGYTQPPGSDHAEIVALKHAGERARDGVMYVTLEPCCHYGRTPPCTEALIAAGISEVHMSIIDPNPKVSGRGEEALQKEGIRTHVGEHEDEARTINEAYIKYIRTGIPFVTAKFASSLDGKIATRTGDSRWISGGESRKYVHYLRYTSDAVMAGANTIIADDPLLTCRYGGTGGAVKNRQIRVIIDGLGRTPPTARIFSEPGKVLIAIGETVSSATKNALARAGAELIEFPARGGKIQMAAILEVLGKREITSVMVEGGGLLLGSLFDDGLVDKVVAFIAPMIIGGSRAILSVSGEGVESVADAPRLERVDVEKFGDDVMVSGYVKK